MAKRKGVSRPSSQSKGDWTALIPTIRGHFATEIGNMLAAVPQDVWDEPKICGVLYDFLPWHEHSLVSIQLHGDDPTDIGAWEHYECVTPDGRALNEEFALYQQASDGLIYHQLLIEAAEALLAIDFTDYGQSEAIEEDGTLNPLFTPQVYHGDQKFRFNYCE